MREEPDGSAHFWTEWRVWPNSPVATYSDGTFGLASLNVWYSFEIQDVGSGRFGLFWAAGYDPDHATWRFIANSPAMPRNVGEVEIEEARFGTANASHQAVTLEKQNRQLSSWSAWSNLLCDQSQNSITGWWAVKYSNQHWQMSSAPPGLC